jgi:Zn-dependent peptidase ImmA (M78 family)
MYEELLREAEREGVEVISWSLKGKTKGLYYNGTIAISESITTTAEKTCVLAEEFGHYYTSCGDIIDQRNTVNKKQEVKARRWAVKRLVTLKNIINAFKAGCRNMYEAAEYIGVTEEFLRQAFETYRQIYGNFKEYGRYVIYFDPPGVFEWRE